MNNDLKMVIKIINACCIEIVENKTNKEVSELLVE